MALLSFLFVLKYVAETKGKTLEQMSDAVEVAPRRRAAAAREAGDA